MYICFLLCLLGIFLTIPLLSLSVEHIKLQEKYGIEQGRKIGEILGIISGWGFFIFWIGIWISPQPRFIIPILAYMITIPFLNTPTTALHILIFMPFFIIGFWFGICGVKELSLKVAETHQPERVVTTGVYSIVRHPQYLGGIFAHIGISFLLSALYSLLVTPLIIAIIYVITKKEETELMREFGEEYNRYKKRVPMLFPRFKKHGGFDMEL
ncbi:MAG: methyltransferase family protein [Candidatus Njordarchaeales archaeon]